MVASKIKPARRDEGRHPTDARGVAPNILDAALHSTAALDAAFPKRTSSLRIPRSVDAFYASSNDAACSSSTFARASRSASRVRTRRETDADHVVPRAAIVRGVALATVTNAKKASSDDSRGMSRREADGTTRPDPTAYVSVALATPSTRDDFVQSPRRMCDFFSRRIGRNRSRDTTSFVDPSRTTTSTTSATIAAFQNLDAVDGASVVLNDADDGVPRDAAVEAALRTVAVERVDDAALASARLDPRRPTFERRAKRDGAKEDTPRTSSSDTPRTSSSDGDSVRARVLRRSTLRAIPRFARRRVEDENAAFSYARIPSERFRSEPPRPAATTVIAGGAGALGLRLAVSIAETSPDARLCLLGRVGRSRRAAFPTSNDGGVFSLLRCDATTSEDAAAANDAIRRRSNRRDSSPLFPSSGVANLTLAGGVLADASLARQRAGSVRATTAPKTNLARRLDARVLAAGANPTFARVTFSSVAALLGSAGQVGYAAANAAMDADAVARRREGVDAVSAQFGAWTGPGMAARDPDVLARVERAGVGAFTPEQGLAALAAIVRRAPSAVVAVSAFDWKTLARNVQPLPPACARRAEAEIREAEIREADAARTTDDRDSASATATIVDANAPSEAEIRSFVTRVVIDLTGNREVAPDEPLMSAGLDSLAGGQLKSAVDAAFSVRLPAAAVYDYPTIAALSSFVCGKVGGARLDRAPGSASNGSASNGSASNVANLAPREPFASSGRALAVTGASFRAPTRADQPAAPSTGDAVRRVPRARWDMQAYQDETHKCLPFSGGFMEGVDAFDAAAFGASQTEALLMDPQHRQLLEMLMHARAAEECTLSSRGDDLEGNGCGSVGCGAFVGIADQGYQHSHIIPFWNQGGPGAAEPVHPYIATGNTLSCAAGRLCFVFGMHGPALSVDTACSSSIVSTHIAATELWNGEIDRAAACGAHSIVAHTATATFFAAGMLSPDGRCKTLDASADGYVRGEAMGVLVLETMLADQIPPGRVSLASTAVNQDGRSSGLTAPSGLAQRAVIRAALDAGSMRPGDVQTLQMHGTGTSLGDPIEFGASLAALGRDDGAPLTLEAVKSFVGHTECASGVVGLAQPAERLNLACSSRVLHLVRVNPHVAGVLDTARMSAGGARPLARVCRQDAAAASRRVERFATCGVGSFAFQGTNGQAILAARPEAAGGPRAVPGARAAYHLFDRQRFWVLPPPHASLRAFASASRAHKWRVLAALDPRAHEHAWDHRVMGRALFPGAGFLEAAIAGTVHALPVDVATSADVVLLECSVPVPMVLPDPSSLPDVSSSGTKKKSSGEKSTRQETVVGLEWRAERGSATVEIASLGGFAASRTPAHLRARVAMLSKGPRTDPESAPDGPESPPPNAFFRRRRERTTPRSLGTVASRVDDEYLGYLVHPACVDNAMQLGAALAFAPKTTPEGTVSKPKVMVPAAVDAFVSPDRAPRAHAFAASTETAKVTANSRTSNHRLTPRVGGASLAAVRGLVVKEMRAGGAAPTVSTRSKPTPGGSGGKGSGRIATSADAPPRVTYAVEWLARAPVAPSDGPTIRARRRSAAKMLLPKSSTVDGFRSRTPARSVALAATLQNAGALAVRSSTRTADAAVGAEGAFPVASRASASAASAHGTIRAAAQELRRTQMDAFDVDPFETDAGVDVDPFARDPTSLGAAREATSRGARILEPVLRARPLAGATFASTRASVSPRHSPPPGRLAVLIRARSVRLADALIREEGTRTGLVGFAGTVADPGETRVAETGTAVFGLLRREDDLEGGDVDSFRLVDASLCALKPSWMSFERAAAIPEPHVRAEAYLRVAVSRRIANDKGPIIVALPDERRGCAVSAAMAARLDDIGATWIESARRNEDEDDGDAEDERKPSVILGAFDDENDVAAALAAVREGGALVKTSTRTRWCSEATRAMFGEMVSHKHDQGARLSGFGSAWRSALFLDDESRAARENRPDVDFVDVNLDDVADAAPAAVSWLASALARGAPTSSRPIAIVSARENAANSFFRDSNAFSNATSFVRAWRRANERRGSPRRR